jgi:transcriptional regulator with XRE-family HTH domain
VIRRGVPLLFALISYKLINQSTDFCCEAIKISAKAGFMSFAMSIRALRSARNWTQADLAKQIGGGITNQSVSGWERGISRPSRENIFELSRIFGVPLERFQIEGDKADFSQPTEETAPSSSASLVFVAIEETLLAAGISEPAAAEIAAVVELALENLRVPHGMTPQGALRRIIGWEVPEILGRKR